MEQANKYQLRGHCQCCGRVQAVVGGGLMSKHGYTVENGWFQGVCQGQNVKPLEVDRTFTDGVVSSIRTKEVPALLEAAAQYRAGTKTPDEIRTNRSTRVNGKYVPVMKAWADCDEYEKQDELTRLAFNAERRAQMGLEFAGMLEKTANEIHGRELIKAERAEKPAPIFCGEKRKNDAGVYTCSYVQGARVYWKFFRTHDGKTFQGWTGIAAWRKLELV